MSEHSERTLWVVRHGMRADFADPQWAATAENPDDPPLDPTGMQQARETAARLASEAIDHIFASPFLRTVQTAHAIARARRMQFNIEAGFGEWLITDDFQSKPSLPDVHETAAQFPTVNTDHRSIGETQFPEDPDALDARIAAALAHVLDAYAGTLLIVSHASPIQSIHLALTGDLPQAMQPMASVTRFDLVAGEWRLSINGDSSHLTNPDTSGRVFRARPAFER